MVRDTNAMIAGMAPVLDPETYHFVTLPEGAALPGAALASFVEDEGLSVILPEALAKELGLLSETPMRRITLSVYSALDGVGLTAAVAGALAEAGIPCNMVAATRHDHAFVPVAQAVQAMTILKALASDGETRDV
ncbi:ACT domain-containing protein [Roseovarius faecimaris]|nr:ACT domain-containing protein [Roseovarius faecimaris]